MNESIVRNAFDLRFSWNMVSNVSHVRIGRQAEEGESSYPGCES